MENQLVVLNDQAAFEAAKIVVKSGLAPRAFDTPEKVLMAWAYGDELGISRMQALQGLNVINGKIGVGGDLARALCEAQSDCEGIEDETIKDKDRITCSRVTVSRRGKPKVVREFSLENAKRAGLIHAGLRADSPWYRYEDRMLYYRALGFALRDAYPHVLKGIKTIEELADYPDATTESRSIIKTAPFIGELSRAPEPAGEDSARTVDPNPIPAPEPPKRPRGRPKTVTPQVEDAPGSAPAPVQQTVAPTPEEVPFPAVSAPVKPEKDLEDPEKTNIINDLRERLKLISFNEYTCMQKLVEYKFKDNGGPVTLDTHPGFESFTLKGLKIIKEHWNGLANALKADAK